MDEVWKREEVESPCVKLCIIHKESGQWGVIKPYQVNFPILRNIYSVAH